MEQHIQTQSQDELLPALSFRPEPTTNYLEHVRHVRFRAAAGDRFSEASRVIRFQLQDSCWLEPSSIRFQCLLTNKDTTAGNLLTPIAPPLCMFSNMKIYAAGQLVENIEELGVLASIIDRTKPAARRIIESAMAHPLVITGDNERRKTIAGGESRRLIFDLPVGLFKCGKLLPLHLLQMLTVELTLADRTQAFTTAGANISDSFDLSDVSLLASCLHVNSTVSAQYHQHLEAGLDMPVTHQVVTGSKFLVTNSTFTLSISRSMTRLKQLYFVVVAVGDKPVRDFVCRADAALTTATDITSFQIACGSYRVPDSPCVGVAETYYRFLQAVGKASTSDDVAVPFARYQANSMIYAVDFEKMGEEAQFTGLNTQGKTLSLIVNNAFDGNNAHEVYVYLVADQILNMKGRAGVDILD